MHRILIFLLGLAAAPWAFGADGAALYSRHCAACHGDTGNGGIGVPLALPSFQASIDDDYLRRTIRHGRPGRVMPAFLALPTEDVEAIVARVRSWSKAPRMRYPDIPVTGDAKRGRKLYDAHCAGCHGAKGEGGHGTGITLSRPRALPVMAPALNNEGFLVSATDTLIKEILMRGRAGTPMESFLKQGLAERDIDDIVSYLRGLQKGTALPASTEAPVLVVESPYDLKTTVENVKRAVSSNNFLLIREQGLDFGLVPEGREDRSRHIVYFCNFQFLNEALGVDPRVGMFLPFRITVVEERGKVRLMAYNPRRLLPMFNNQELKDLADELTRRTLAILEESTL
ncbi:MAG: c-type cytochrome [Betaproteobacteria bacterium]|nr:c-type cytochrome [Betaproteobacteria bacterium]